MKLKSYGIQIGVAALLSAAVAVYRMELLPADTAGRVQAFSDAFFIVGVLYSCIGSLLWVATTGFFDVFSYAFRKGAHALFPGRIFDAEDNFYDYKLAKLEKREKTRVKVSTLLIGLSFLAAAVVLTVVWYSI